MLGELFQVDATLDPKGRIVLPARLRKKLEASGIDSLVFMCYPQLSIFAFTPEEWDRQVAGRLTNADPFNPQVLTFAHGLLAGASSVDIDGQGRVLIPPKLREKAGLDRKVVVQAFMGRLEIWDADRWAERERAAEEGVPSLGGTPGANEGEV